MRINGRCMPRKRTKAARPSGKFAPPRVIRRRGPGFESVMRISYAPVTVFSSEVTGNLAERER
jgi:hypothetical protein